MLEYVVHFVYQRQVITHGVEFLNANTVRAAQLASIALFEEDKANGSRGLGMDNIAILWSRTAFK